MSLPSDPKETPTTSADRIADAGLNFMRDRAVAMGGRVQHMVILVRMERMGAAAVERHNASSASAGFDNNLEMLSAMIQHVQAVAASAGIDREALAALIRGGGSDG